MLMTRNNEHRVIAWAHRVLRQRPPKRIGLGLLFACLFFASGVVTRSAPPDKSGVKPSVLSLPSGAGSIEGLGESFEPQLNTGGSSYGVSVSLPPGRAGLAPSIRLSYNSYSGNGICGIGWSLEFMAVKRQTDKGFPEYDSGDTFVFAGEELVPLNNAGQDWRCENERDFQRLRRIDSDSDGAPDAWEVTERNGTKHTLGRFRGQNNRWSVVEHPEKAAAPAFDRTSCWMVDSTTDLHGNRIEYEYVQGSSVLYPSRITYSHLADNFHEVIFQYEARPDAFDDYRPAFSARLDRRLTRIEVRTQSKLVRAYNLAYAYAQGDLTPDQVALQSTYLDLGVTLLRRFVQVDRSGSDANFLPPLIFTYSGLDLTKAEQRSFALPPELDLAEPNGRVQLADLDGDALPDLLATSVEGAGKVQRVCLNRGESRTSGVPKLLFAPSKQVLGSSPVDLAEPNTVVHDPKGKGLIDLSALTDDGPNKRLETFGNRSRLDLVDENRLGFSLENLEATILENPPSWVTYSQAGTRQMDVNFDKRGDFVNLEPTFGAMKVNTFYIGRSGRWLSSEAMLPPSYPLANTFAGPDGQPNPCVHLADMNGDRLLDLICLAAAPSPTGQRIRISYWALSGLGRYAEERTVPTQDPDTFEIGSADLRDIFVEDITGDGLADVVVLDGSGPETVMTLRVNIAGQRWSPPYVKTGLPRYAPRDPASPTVLRLADLNANGSLDLLFRNTAPQDSWVYLELLPRGRPSLMTGVDNSLGKRTTIVYGSAAEDEQLARESGHPWRTFAPLALQVVRQIRTTCGQDLNGDGWEDAAVAEFRYRDPFYDGIEREFRGFARTPTGQLSGPSLVTRYRFYTGAADQKDNDDYGPDVPAFRLIDEYTEVGGREEEPLKGLQVVEEQIDPVVLHSALDGGFDAGCAAADAAATPEAQGKLTPDAYVYARSRQEWTVRRLYRPAEAVPYLADQDADGVLEDYRSTPAVPVPAGRFASQGVTVLAGNGHSVSFAFASRQTNEVREANGLLSSVLGYPQAPVARTSKAFDYDDFGNQTLMQDLGLENAAFDDERIITTTYAQAGNALSLWVLDKPDTVTTTDENGEFVAKTVYYYDGEPFVGIQGQVQNRALVSRRVDHIDASRTIQATRTKFDARGNIEETHDAVGNIRRHAWDPVFQTYPITETMVVGGGSLDLNLEAEYDLGFGVVTRSADFNGNITTYGYDSFGRLVKIVRPGDTVDLPTSTFEYQPCDPIRGRAFVYDAAGNLALTPVPLGSVSRVTTRQREEAGKTGEYLTAVYSDGTGKTLATLEEGEVAGTWEVRQATSYNLRGQEQSQWLSYQVSSTDTPQFPLLWPSGRPPVRDEINPAVVATDFYYDPQGREIRRFLPPETWDGPRREGATQYLPFEKRAFDEEDLRAGSAHAQTPLAEFSDGLGRVIAVEEVVKITDTGVPGPLAVWRTEYAYDLNDQLIHTKDSQGNVKIMTYDGLKRMIRMNDPDRGQTTFTYDDASNLRETIDAKSQKIIYTYDGVNRIKTEDYQDGGPRVPDVEYFYDAPLSGLDLGDGTTGAGSNTKGQIAFVRDLSGETHFSYDARARIQWEVKRVPDRLHGQLVSYRTRFAYDSADRLSDLTYPDGDEVTHSYNTRNLLARIHGSSLGEVIAAISYRPSGQIQQIRYGNRVNTAFSYDPRLRLTGLQTANNQGARLIDFEYTFDAASNIQRIEDRRSLTGLPEAAARLNTQVFTYDSLYRLSRVEYPVLGTSDSHHIAYHYDRIGNMLGQTSDITQVENGHPAVNLGEMQSGGTKGRSDRNGRSPDDPPGPHALTSLANRPYAYDPNGNMISFDGLVCEWDFKNRLAAIENDQMRAVYNYDYLDRRVTKTVHWKHPGPDNGEQPSPLNPSWRTTTVHYINRNFEVREHDSLVKYVWNKQIRVARITAQLGATVLIQHLRLREGWNHVCLTVGGAFPSLDPANNADIRSSAYFSDAGSGAGLIQVTATTPVPAGAVLWVYARRDMTVVLTGVPAAQAFPELTGKSQFIGNVFPEPLDPAALLPASAWMARYDTSAQRWFHLYPGSHELASLNDASALVLPGQALWTTGGTSGPLSNNLAVLQVRYYHPDHLGSAALITDQNGELVEESANYPFGHLRASYRPKPLHGEPYGFTQKEKDEESGLHYFEARYLASTYGRFASVDPLITIDMKGLGRIPQNLNLYASSHNNPLKYVDPLGLEVKATTTDMKGGSKVTNIKFTGVLIDESGKNFTDAELKSIQARIVKQVQSDFQGSAGKHLWNSTVDIRIVKSAADIKANDHVIHLVDSVDGALGDVDDIGGKQIRVKASLVAKRPYPDGRDSSLERTASHELGHTLGLRHDTDPANTLRDKMGTHNLMRQTHDTKSTQINVHQIREIQRLYDAHQLNQ